MHTGIYKTIQCSQLECSRVNGGKTDPRIRKALYFTCAAQAMAYVIAHVHAFRQAFVARVTKTKALITTVADDIHRYFFIVFQRK